MVIAAGILLLALGLYLAFISWPAILGALSLALIFAGGVAFIVGYSERRARGDYQQAIEESSSSQDLDGEASAQVTTEKRDQVVL